MKKVLLISSWSLLLTCCMSSEFILTGVIHEPISDNHPVRVILTGNRENIDYEEIGVLRVKQSDMDNLSKAVELAKSKARIKGGDIVLLYSSDSKTSVAGNAYLVSSSERNFFIFIIGKLNK